MRCHCGRRAPRLESEHFVSAKPEALGISAGERSGSGRSDGSHARLGDSTAARAMIAKGATAVEPITPGRDSGRITLFGREELNGDSDDLGDSWREQPFHPMIGTPAVKRRSRHPSLLSRSVKHY